MHHHAHAHSRRDFFSRAFGGALAGASIIEEAFLRATWARAQAPGASTSLFKIEKVADGVYAALARPQVLTNCNAAIFVNSQDVLVVDAHSKPSAAAALIAQIKKDVTTKPVRYLVNSHFHWDHTQGDAAYKAGGAKVDIIASDTTKQLMTQLSRNRLKESLDGVPKQIDDVQARLAKATSAADKERYTDLIRQLKAYQTEMKKLHARAADHYLCQVARDQGHRGRSAYRVPRARPHCRRHRRVLAAETRGGFGRRDYRLPAEHRRRVSEAVARDDQFSGAARFRSHHSRTRAGPPRPRAHDANAELYRGANRARRRGQESGQAAG